jgi:hypothetical protein
MPFRLQDSCGIGRRTAELWGFCGDRRTPSQLPQTTARVPKSRRLRVLMTTFRVAHPHRCDLAASGNSAPATRHPSRPMSACRGFKAGCLRLSEVGSNLIDPAVNEREEALDATVSYFGQWDFWPLAAQDILTVKPWYSQDVQVCGHEVTGMLTVIWRRIAHLIYPDPQEPARCHASQRKAPGFRGDGHRSRARYWRAP